MPDFISVIVPSYNPDISRLNQTLMGLKGQTFPLENWELLIIDNNSTPAITIDLNWHPNSKIIIADDPGLTHARLKGFEQASGKLIVMVDDDNILDQNYLQNTLNIFNTNRCLGSAGGKSLPIFEKIPPAWMKEFYSSLAIRDMGEMELTSVWENQYPSQAPIGAGMAIRKQALTSYINKLPVITDRKGSSLSSGGDNDIVIEILKSGWQVGYFPSLILYHIIPAERLSVKYLARLSNDSNKSWIQLLESHGINPWKKIQVWTVPLRKVKAWFVYKAWLNSANYIKWKGACGAFEGLSD